MYDLQIDPKSDLIKGWTQKRQDNTRRVDDFEVAAGYENYIVYNKTNDRKHNVKVLQVSNVGYKAQCDCEDFNFNRKHEALPCIHVFKVIHESQVEKMFELEGYVEGSENLGHPNQQKVFHEENEAPQVDNPGADEGAEETAEGATRIDKALDGNTNQAEERRLSAPKTGTQIQEPAIVVPAIDEETAIEHFQRFQRLKQRVLADSDYIFYDSSGKPTKDRKKATNEYIQKSGWRKISLMFNISTRIISKNKSYGEDGAGQYYVWTYLVEAIAPNGRVQEAEGVCTSRDPFFCKRKNKDTGEYEWIDTDEKNIKHTAQTRAFNRVISDLVGSGELSAEEV